MPFISNTASQQEQMLSMIGLSMGDLFADIPPQLTRDNFDLPDQVSEMEVLKNLSDLADKGDTVRVNFDLDSEQHTKLRMQALKEKKTVKQFLTELIAQALD